MSSPYVWNFFSDVVWWEMKDVSGKAKNIEEKIVFTETLNVIYWIIIIFLFMVG